MNRRYLLLATVLTAIFVAGCLGGSPQETDGVEESDDEIRYVNQSNGSLLEITADRSTETFDLHFEFHEDFGSSPYSPRKHTNLTLSIGCGLMSKYAYNLTGLQQSDGFERQDDPEFPAEVIKNYSAGDVTVEVWDTDRSERYGSCDVSGEGEFEKSITAG